MLLTCTNCYRGDWSAGRAPASDRRTGTMARTSSPSKGRLPIATSTPNTAATVSSCLTD